MHSRTWKNLALLAGATLAALLIAELTVRVAFRNVTTTYDNRSYFAMKWKRDHVAVNSLGFREREFDRQKPRDTYRIALIGDSFGFGQGIAVEERLSRRVESGLQARGHKAEVLFFGETGMNTADELTVLREILPIAKPDFVLLQWFVNDVEIPVPSASGVTSRPPRSAWASLKLSIRNVLALYFVAASAWHQVIDDQGAAYVGGLARRFGDPASPDSRRADEALRSFLQACRESTSGCGVVLVPYLSPLGNGQYPFAYLHDRVLATCRSANVTCLDLRSTFEPFMRQNDYRTLWVNQFDSHMGPLANQLAAEAVIETYEKEWTLTAASSAAATPR